MGTTTSRTVQPLELHQVEEHERMEQTMGCNIEMGKMYLDTNTGAVGKCTGIFTRLNAMDRVELSGIDSTGRPFRHWVDVSALATRRGDASGRLCGKISRTV